MTYTNDPYEGKNILPETKIITIQPTEYKKEKRLYRELIAIYRSLKNSALTYADSETVKRVNEILLKFNLHNSEYKRYLYSTNRLMPNQRFFMDRLNVKLSSVLELISEDFGFEDPNYLLNQYMQTNGATINNQINSIANANSNQKQNQKQNIQITIKQIEKLFDEFLSKEQQEEIKLELEKYKSNPRKWVFIQDLIMKLLKFGMTTAPIIKVIMDYFST